MFFLVIPLTRAFPLFENFSIAKVFGIIYVFSLMIIPSFCSKLFNRRVSLLIVLFLILFSAMNVINAKFFSSSVLNIDYTFLLNIIILFIFLTHSKIDGDVLPNAFRFIGYGSMILFLAYMIDLHSISIYGRVYIGSALPNSIAFTCAIGVVSLIDASRNVPYNRNIFLNTKLLIYFLNIACLIWLLILTGSRSGFITLLSILFLLFLFKKSKIINITIAFCICVLVIFIDTSIFSVVIERLDRTISDFEFGGRMKFWKILIQHVDYEFIFGMSRDQYSQLTSDIMGYNISPHNIFLESFLIGGVIGLIALTAIYLMIFYMAIKLQKINNDITGLLIFIIIFVQGMTGQIFNNTVYFVLLAMVVCKFRKIKFVNGQ